MDRSGRGQGTAAPRRVAARRSPAMTAPQSRDWARRASGEREVLGTASPLRQAPPARGAGRPLPTPGPEEGARSPGSRYLVGVAWGTIWRYLVVGGISLAMFTGLRPPPAAVAIVAGIGVILGLWFRGWWIAGLWRAALLGWAAGMFSPLWLFPYAIAVALVVVTVEPWLTGHRLSRGGEPRLGPGRRRQPEQRVHAVGRPPGRADPSLRGPSRLPSPTWPQARRRS